MEGSVLSLKTEYIRLVWAAFSLALACLLARRGLRKNSLATSGAIAAFMVGAIHMYCGLQYGLTLIFFYLSSSKLTRVGSGRKALVEAQHVEGGRRSATQVLANSAAACAFAAASRMLVHTPGGSSQLPSVLLAGAFLGHYACCTADTWASELGVLSRSPPRLITTGRQVPPGTNGGVSALGLACSVAGGLATGLAFFAAGAAGCAMSAAPTGGSICIEPPTLARQGSAWQGCWYLTGSVKPGWGPAGLLPLLAVGLACGLFGSLLDSVLGATLQYTGWDTRTKRVVGRPPSRQAGEEPGLVKHVSGIALLSNEGVNFLSAAASAAMGAFLLARMTV